MTPELRMLLMLYVVNLDLDDKSKKYITNLPPPAHASVN